MKLRDGTFRFPSQMSQCTGNPSPHTVSRVTHEARQGLYVRQGYFLRMLTDPLAKLLCAVQSHLRRFSFRYLFDSDFDK